MNKAIYDKDVKSRNLISSISGVVTILVTLLVAFGVINPDQQAGLQSHVTTLMDAGVMIWGAIQGILLIFKYKDA